MKPATLPLYGGEQIHTGAVASGGHEFRLHKEKLRTGEVFPFTFVDIETGMYCDKCGARMNAAAPVCPGRKP